MTPEGRIMREVQLACSKLGARMFRRQVGTFWSGRPEKQRDGTTILRDARPVKIGIEGEPDLGGFTPTLITAEMVGSVIPIATVIEVKTAKGRLSKPQVAYLKAAQSHGLIAGVARSVEDVSAILSGEARLK